MAKLSSHTVSEPYWNAAEQHQICSDLSNSPRYNLPDTKLAHLAPHQATCCLETKPMLPDQKSRCELKASLSSKAESFIPSWEHRQQLSNGSQEDPSHLDIWSVDIWQPLQLDQLPIRTPSSPGTVSLLSKAAASTTGWLSQAAEIHAEGLPQMPVENAKNPDESQQQPSSSAESEAMSGILLHQHKLNMLEKHNSGQCSPCGYLYKKQDGCRMGDKCLYCHVCTADELARRRNLKFAAMKEEKRRRKLLASTFSVESTLSDQVVARS